MFKDLQDFIKALEDRKALKRITTPVDAHLEITEITDRVSKQYGSALLFEHVKGYRYPVLINALGSYERMAFALGAENLNDIAGEIGDLINLNGYASLTDKIRAIPKLAPLAFIFPQKVSAATCQQVVEQADLDTLPILKCWPGDGGPFITLPLVFTKDPETGQQNMGMYRMQKYDKTTTGMHWHIHKDGSEIYRRYQKLSYDKMPVSVAIGCDPAIIYAASAPLPKMIDELLFAGFLRKKAVPVVKCISNDLYVPADAEFVIEGYVNIGELREEGPFGDHTGYYSLKDMYPVFHAETITRKKEPVYCATVVGQPPMEDCYMGKATERIFLPLISMQAPEIVDMNLPMEGVFHNCAIVAIRKSFPKHAFKVMHTLWGLGQMMYTKMIIVVDEQVDPHDVSKVMWKVFNNIDPHRDLLVAEGPLDALDHSSNTPQYGYRLGIDATKKWPEEGHTREWPDDITMTEEIKKMVDKKWVSYGL